jgi:hypothetical protein
MVDAVTDAVLRALARLWAGLYTWRVRRATAQPIASPAPVQPQFVPSLAACTAARWVEKTGCDVLLVEDGADAGPEGFLVAHHSKPRRTS